MVVGQTSMGFTRGTRRIFMKIEPCQSFGDARSNVRAPELLHGLSSWLLGNSHKLAWSSSYPRPGARGKETSRLVTIVAPPPPSASMYQLFGSSRSLLESIFHLAPNNGVLTWDNLAKRRKVEDDTCLFCTKKESVLHVFFDCP
jgi:hypothetical protein